jgi:dTDP-4-dehydrorhamnose reductase
MPKLLILGASGMLGSTLIRFFSKVGDIEVFGTIRSSKNKENFTDDIRDKLIEDVSINSLERLQNIFSQIKPDIVINCIGLVKQDSSSNDPLQAILVNSYWPHRLAEFCNATGSRLIQVSTDCVFSGDKGNYLEDDFADANDLYGRTKFLGELNYANTVTLRTSIIGHELLGNKGLIEWFLAQNNNVSGYKNVFFSGLPAIELAVVIKNYVIPNQSLSGIFHVSVDPISKFKLLEMVANEYRKDIKIEPDSTLKINRTLDSTKFRLATGYSPKSWTQLIAEMHSFG